MLSLRRTTAATLTAITALTAAVTTATVTAAPAEAAGCSTALAGKTIRTAPGTGKTVALTIDDGGSKHMPQILEVLRRHNVRATFFNTGAHDAAYPAQATAAAKAGHLVQPHTWEHQRPSKANGYWSVSYLKKQITSTAAQQTKLTGQRGCFFRPPGGNMTNVTATVKSLGLANVLWTVDSQDWRQPGKTTQAATAAIVKNATNLAYANKSHPIVLLHAGKASHEPESQVSSNRSNTIAALPAIIAWYKARGYRFVDMYGRTGVVGAPTATPVKGFDADGRPDVLARAKDGALVLYRGTGTGALTSGARIGSGWQGFNTVLAPGDLTGDGRTDLLARTPGGTLYRYAGNGSGGFASGATRIGTGWHVFTQLLSGGDVTGDRRTDLLAVKADGSLYLYAGTGKGTFHPGRKVGAGWSRYTALVAPGDVTGDGRADLLGRDGAGALHVAAGSGTGTFAAAKPTTGTWGGYTALLSAGDLNRDGRADLLGRDGAGRLVFHAGTGTGAFAAGRQVGSGWAHPIITGAR